ncbi:MAG: tRNA (guanosine(37)-N1)-methyltransferase TrmD [Syntrophaceae bacterium]|nr:tRNA (guanosine(37)-N1)-methyltransferase TrmD [Syntrophaceae bacterium]
MLEVRVITIFPRIFDSFMEFGNPARAVGAGLLKFKTIDLRDFTEDRHRTTDDYPYGGGTGMIMKPEPIVKAIRSVRSSLPQTKVILTTPQGKRLDQTMVKLLVGLESMAFVCGRYEGIDERVRNFVDEEVSIGDFILSGGETAVMVIMDAVVRLIPGVLGADSNIDGESFYDGLLEYPQYTRPRIFEGLETPEILLEGHHEKIRIWRKKMALAKTLIKRPDLLENRESNKEEQQLLNEIKSEQNIHVGEAK